MEETTKTEKKGLSQEELLSEITEESKKIRRQREKKKEAGDDLTDWLTAIKNIRKKYGF